MALTNNLVVTLKDHTALAEALAQRQPGDRLTLNGVEVIIVENLPERASFDVETIGDIKGRDATADGPAEVMSPEDSSLADSVLSVMSKKGKAA